MSGEKEANGITAVFGALALAAGVLFASSGWSGYERDRSLRAITERTEAQIVALDVRRDAKGDREHLVRYRFTLADGRSFEVERAVDGTAWRKLKIGSPLTVVYRPEDPNQGFPLSGGATSAGLARLAVAIGGVMALGGLALLGVVARRLYRRPRDGRPAP